MTDEQLMDFLERYKDIPDDKMIYISAAFLKEVYLLVERQTKQIEELGEDIAALERKIEKLEGENNA